MKNFALIFLTCCFCSCNLDADTVDPQSSINIAASKKNDLFVAQYKCESQDTQFFRVSEAWVEHVWFNKLVGGALTRRKSPDLQLNLALTNFSDTIVAKDKYIVTWEMKDDSGEVLGAGNGVFLLFLKSHTISDSIRLGIYKILDDRARRPIGHLLLVRQL